MLRSMVPVNGVVRVYVPVLASKMPKLHIFVPDAGEIQAYIIEQPATDTSYEAVKEEVSSESGRSI